MGVQRPIVGWPGRSKRKAEITMAIFLGILYALQLLVALLLILIILMQRTASEGLGLAFGGGMGESFFGSRAGNVLVKITAYLSVFFICNTLLIAKLQTVQGRSMVRPGAPVAASAEAIPAGQVATPGEGVSAEVPSPADAGAVVPAGEAPLSIEIPAVDAGAEVAPVEAEVAPVEAGTTAPEGNEIEAPAPDAASPVEASGDEAGAAQAPDEPES